MIVYWPVRERLLCSWAGLSWVLFYFAINRCIILVHRLVRPSQNGALLLLNRNSVFAEVLLLRLYCRVLYRCL
ncbi:hypothetical protein [Gilvimarinus polysaccharolyticus]|uniref:hypothetical protein n=1 Tax=Gilvimarinus polysaccharolyticus TaxID=863921 RepID=UPI0006736C92|nr:hypothetical protein [Gilvimarinus polysaccharolyticus]